MSRAGSLSKGTSGPSCLPMLAGSSSFPRQTDGPGSAQLSVASVFLSGDFAAYLGFRKS